MNCRISLQAGHASPVKWCLNEKGELLCKLAMSSIRFAGWTLTEGQHQPKAGKKKKTREAGLFFSGSRFVVVMLHHEVG